MAIVAVAVAIVVVVVVVVVVATMAIKSNNKYGNDNEWAHGVPAACGNTGAAALGWLSSWPHLHARICKCVTADLTNLAMQWHGKRKEMKGKEGTGTFRINEEIWVGEKWK